MGPTSLLGSNYGKYCCKAYGELYRREGIQKMIAEWLKQGSPDPESGDFVERADSYLKAMPAFAEK